MANMEVSEIGRSLRLPRKRLGVTQTDAAELADILERTVRDIEKGKDSPSFAAYAELAHVVGMWIEVAVRSRVHGFA